MWTTCAIILIVVVCQLIQSTYPTHLTLVGTPQQLSFIRHPNPKLKLSSQLPALIITRTESNLISAINPRNGTIIWRFVLPTYEPILNYVTDLDHGLVGVISSHQANEPITRIRLLSLSQGRVIWENDLGDRPDNSSHELIFSPTDQGSGRSRPDLIITDGTKVHKLDGTNGNVKWTYTSSRSPITRLIIYSAEEKISQLEVVSLNRPTTARSDSDEIHITTLSTSDGNLISTRQSSLRCQIDNEKTNPLTILRLTNTTNVLACKSPDQTIGYVHISSDVHQPLKTLTYTPSKSNDRALVLQDIGLSHHGILLIRSGNAQEVEILRLSDDGIFQSAWKFTDQVTDAVFAGSIDRDGLPYISRVSYAKSLGLGSFEIVALSSTEFSPDGMITGITFKHDQIENGPIKQIALEVLQTKNYVPFSRFLIFTELGTIQLWQGEQLQWERHEDLSEIGAVLPYNKKISPSDYLSGDGGVMIAPNLVGCLARNAQDLVNNFLDLKKSNVPEETPEKIWFLGTSMGRLFAIDHQDSRILWKRRIPLKTEGSSIRWSQLVLRHFNHSSVLDVTLLERNEEVSAQIELNGGRIMEVKSLVNDHIPHIESVEVKKKVIAVHDRDLGGSPARFLGDRGALFKYHNPNLRVRLVERTIEVFDQMTSSLVWSFEIDDRIDPDSIMATLTENWLMIGSRETDSGISRLDSIEWFMSSKADVRVDGSSVNLTTCSRSYMVPYSIKALGLSKSRLGVTSRALLVINEMDQIITLSKRLLDCRRPLGKPSKDDIEEQLIMYDPAIHFDPKSVINADQQTAGLKRVYSFPTEFESTALVIGMGLDLYMGLVSPSRSFDQLGDQFNKLQLVLTTSALLLGVLGLRPVVKNKQLKRLWYT